MNVSSALSAAFSPSTRTQAPQRSAPTGTGGTAQNVQTAPAGTPTGNGAAAVQGSTRVQSSAAVLLESNNSVQVRGVNGSSATGPATTTSSSGGGSGAGAFSESLSTFFDGISGLFGGGTRDLGSTLDTIRQAFTNAFGGGGSAPDSGSGGTGQTGGNGSAESPTSGTGQDSPGGSTTGGVQVPDSGNDPAPQNPDQDQAANGNGASDPAQTPGNGNGTNGSNGNSGNNGNSGAASGAGAGTDSLSNGGVTDRPGNALGLGQQPITQSPGNRAAASLNGALPPGLAKRDGDLPPGLANRVDDLQPGSADRPDPLSRTASAPAETSATATSPEPARQETARPLQDYVEQLVASYQALRGEQTVDLLQTSVPMPESNPQPQAEPAEAGAEQENDPAQAAQTKPARGSSFDLSA